MENKQVTQQETQTDPTKRFFSGAVLVALSLILGKLVLIPIILFPGNEQWGRSMLIVYIFSWIMLVIGIYLCGMEGYRFVKNTYSNYQQKTIATVKHHSAHAAKRTVQAIKSKARSGFQQVRKNENADRK